MRDGDASRGQSIVELLLVLPIILLMLMAAVDFGRLFLGWVVLNNAARVGANYAALYADAWESPGNAARRDTYTDLVTDARDDASITLSGCSGVAVPDPTFPGGKDIGDYAVVSLDCGFTPLTPLISEIFGPNGDPLRVSARSVFAIRTGAIDGPAITPTPVCHSMFEPTDDAGPAPLTVDFTDTTVGGSGPYLWDFGDATASTLQNPSKTYANPGTYQVVFRVSGCNPALGEVTVIDASETPDPNATPGASPSIDPGCIVPAFIGTKKNSASATWTAAGFTTLPTFDPDPNGNWTIEGQSLVGGFAQECNVDITLSPDPLASPGP